MASTRDDVREVVERYFGELATQCPPDTLLVATVVMVDGHASIAVVVNPAASEGGPPTTLLRDALENAAKDYLKRCPHVVWADPSNDKPS